MTLNGTVKTVKKTIRSKGRNAMLAVTAIRQNNRPQKRQKLKNCKKCKKYKVRNVTRKVDDTYESLNDDAALLLNYTEQHADQLKLHKSDKVDNVWGKKLNIKK